MKTRLKVSLTVVLLVVLGLLAHAVFALMNIPSTAALLLGLAVAIFAFILVPPLFVRIWRKSNEDSQNKPTA